MLSLWIGVLVQSGAAREVTNIDADWRFIRQDVAGAELSVFDDSGWDRISIPHTWNAKDGQDGGGNYYRGVGWYRTTLKIPAYGSGKRYFLRFEAASLVADVYLNGQSIGQHRGGFTAFCFEITGKIKPGANVIAVKVDNKGKEDVAPYAADFTFFGGLYRSVSLITLDTVCISPLDFASPGVYLTPGPVNAGAAQLEAKVLVSNGGKVPAITKTEVRILDRDGRMIARLGDSRPVAAGASEALISHARISQPHLWNGKADPYLYTAEVTLYSNGRVTDTLVQPFGFREFKMDKDSGFILNGAAYPLHGVNRHQCREDKGWAISRADQDEDMALIDEIGANAVRLAHYPQDDYFLTMLDKKGICVYEEIPVVNCARTNIDFVATCKIQLEEMIKQHYNHPSVIVWGLFNELGNGDNAKFRPAYPLFAKQLVDEVHRLDKTRPAGGVNDSQSLVDLANSTDVCGINTYPGWYYGDAGREMPGLIDSWNKIFGQRGIAVTEYGAGASIYHHVEEPGHPYSNGMWHPEEWQMMVHENTYKGVLARKSVWGSFLWVMFDFAADNRNEGDRPGINDKGLVTHSRKTRKDAFYFYKANWSPEPFVHLTGKRLNNRNRTTTSLKAYSNCDQVRFIVNSNEVGTVKGDTGVFLVPNVKLKKGDNEVQVQGVKIGGQIIDRAVFKVNQE
jgi:beta-galactosidase